MKGSKILRALEARKAEHQRNRADASNKLAFDAEMHVPGSENPRKGYKGQGKPERRKRTQKELDGQSRKARRAGTKSEDRNRIRGLTRGAKRHAQRQVRMAEPIREEV